jgi:NADH-quinone oxidoreductase subunit M
MILIYLILILIAGGLVAWISGRAGGNLPRWVTLLALGIAAVIVAALWTGGSSGSDMFQNSGWMAEIELSWIPQLGIQFHLALDGLSLIMISLTIFLGILSVLASWTGITYKTGFFHFNILWILAGIIGVFLAMDLFLFYFFWELMLIPMYFLIGIWGHENSKYAAIKFFIFTQASGLLMLLSIIGLYLVQGRATGIYSFDYVNFLGNHIDPGLGRLLALGFLAAFLVKLPAVPFHTWLPDAHTEAPTAGSVILAGLLLKTGAYGMLRFVLPIFPEISAELAPWAMILGVAGILYGAKLAFSQTDMKRMVAYTSVSHMGFVLLGIFAFNQIALQGVVMQMVTHGISTGALFILAGLMQERLHTRDMDLMGGLWDRVPRMAAVGMIFAMASLGLPGLGNFVAEILVLLGAFQADQVITIIATMGLIAATVYALRFVQQVFHGKARREWQMKDFNKRELGIAGAMIIVIVWLGFYPQPLINTAAPALEHIRDHLKQPDIYPSIRNMDDQARQLYLFPGAKATTEQNTAGTEKEIRAPHIQKSGKAYYRDRK